MENRKWRINFLIGCSLLVISGLSQAKEPHLKHHEPLTRQLKSTQTYIHDLKGRCLKGADTRGSFDFTGFPACSIHFSTKDYNTFYEGSPPPLISAGRVQSFYFLEEFGILPGMNAYGGAKFSLSKLGTISEIEYVTTADIYTTSEGRGFEYVSHTDPASIEKGYYALKDARGNYWAAYKLYTGDKAKWYVGSKVKHYWLHCQPTDTFSREYGCYGKLEKHYYRTRNGKKFYYYDRDNKRRIYPLPNKPVLIKKEFGVCIKNGRRVRC